MWAAGGRRRWGSPSHHACPSRLRNRDWGRRCLAPVRPLPPSVTCASLDQSEVSNVDTTSKCCHIRKLRLLTEQEQRVDDKLAFLPCLLSPAAVFPSMNADILLLASLNEALLGSVHIRVTALRDPTAARYDYVARHFLGSISPDATFRRTSVQLNAGGEHFSALGVVPLRPGFTAIMPWKVRQLLPSVAAVVQAPMS